jgi:hypothetical protein
MRLFEVEERFAGDLEMVLRNLMGRSNQKDASLKLSYAAISNMLKNMGYGSIDHEQFKKIHDSNVSIQNIVRDFDDNTVMISTEVEKEDDPEAAPESELSRSKTVDQMADRSATDYVSDPLR